MLRRRQKNKEVQQWGNLTDDDDDFHAEDVLKKQDLSALEQSHDDPARKHEFAQAYTASEQEELAAQMQPSPSPKKGKLKKRLTNFARFRSSQKQQQANAAEEDESTPRSNFLPAPSLQSLNVGDVTDEDSDDDEDMGFAASLGPYMQGRHRDHGYDDDIMDDRSVQTDAVPSRSPLQSGQSNGLSNSDHAPRTPTNHREMRRRKQTRSQGVRRPKTSNKTPENDHDYDESEYGDHGEDYEEDGVEEFASPRDARSPRIPGRSPRRRSPRRSPQVPSRGPPRRPPHRNQLERHRSFNDDALSGRRGVAASKSETIPRRKANTLESPRPGERGLAEDADDSERQSVFSSSPGEGGGERLRRHRPSDASRASRVSTASSRVPDRTGANQLVKKPSFLEQQLSEMNGAAGRLRNPTDDTSQMSEQPSIKSSMTAFRKPSHEATEKRYPSDTERAPSTRRLMKRASSRRIRPTRRKDGDPLAGTARPSREGVRRRRHEDGEESDGKVTRGGHRPHEGGSDEKGVRRRRPKEEGNTDGKVVRRRRPKDGEESDGMAGRRRRHPDEEESDGKIVRRRKPRDGEDSDGNIVRRRKPRDGEDSDGKIVRRRKPRDGEESDGRAGRRKKPADGQESDGKVVRRRRPVDGEESDSKKVRRRRPADGEESDSKKIRRRRPVDGEESDGKVVRRRRPADGEESDGKKVRRRRPVDGEESDSKVVRRRRPADAEDSDGNIVRRRRPEDRGVQSRRVKRSTSETVRARDRHHKSTQSSTPGSPQALHNEAEIDASGYGDESVFSDAPREEDPLQDDLQASLSELTPTKSPEEKRFGTRKAKVQGDSFAQLKLPGASPGQVPGCSPGEKRSLGVQYIDFDDTPDMESVAGEETEERQG